MNTPYFLTCTVVGWLPVFTQPETVQILNDSWRFLQDNGRLTIYGYVILENHLHLILTGNLQGNRRFQVLYCQASCRLSQGAQCQDVTQMVALSQSSPQARSRIPSLARRKSSATN